MATGAIATLVDELGAVIVHEEGVPPTAVSVDMSVSYISPAKLNVGERFYTFAEKLKHLLHCENHVNCWE